ncbi:MAG: hypothetical protein J6L71_02840, partial [Clostridia bacterium]|nr:hypothetical protein [Clostridia bacterium]
MKNTVKILIFGLIMALLTFAIISCGGTEKPTEAPMENDSDEPISEAPTDTSEDVPTEAPTEAPIVEPTVTAKDLVNGALAKYMTHYAVESYSFMNITMSVSGVEIEIPMATYMAIKDVKSDSPIAFVSMATSVLGM